MTHGLIDVVRESLTLWLGASVLLSFASAWAFVKAVRSDRPGRDRNGSRG